MPKRSMQIRLLLSRLKNRIYSFDLQDIYRQRHELREEEDRPPEMSTVFEVHDQPEILETIDKINELSPREQAFARQRLQAGDQVVIGFRQGKPVFYGWLMFDEIEITYGIFRDLPKGSVFAYNLFTAPSCRRRGAVTDFYRFVVKYLRRKQLQTLYCGIATGNEASIIAHRKNGFEKDGYFYTLKILGTCLTLARFEHAGRFYLNRG